MPIEKATGNRMNAQAAESSNSHIRSPPRGKGTRRASASGKATTPASTVRRAATVSAGRSATAILPATAAPPQIATAAAAARMTVDFRVSAAPMGPLSTNPAGQRHGSTSTFAWVSGLARSANAWRTPSSPTRPVISGDTSMRPSAM